MKIKTLKFSLVLLAALSLMTSCKDDDDINVIPFVLEDRTEQQAKDKDSLMLYLSTHYYNSGDFETGTNHKYTDIIIEKLDEGESVPVDHTLLQDAVETHTAEYLEVDYEYYILKINQGGGDAPTYTDQIRFRYEGSTIDNDSDEVNVFDYNITPNNFHLQQDGFNPSPIKGWQLVFPEFNAAASFNTNNGSVEYNDFGLGVMFIPSGLAYFASPPSLSSINSYDNLVFKIELLQVEVGDPDADGIPSFFEDLDNDGDVVNDDTDEDGIANFIDRDDDNDEVLTLDELIPNTYTVDTNIGETEPVLADGEYERSRTTSNGIITIKTVTIEDSNNDGTPDYLDINITTNYNETGS